MKAVTSRFNSVNTKAVKSIFFGAFIGTLISIILILLSSVFIVIIGKLPDNSLDYITLGILAAGSFLGGYIGSRINKSSGIFIGLTVGIIMFLIVFLAGIGSFTGTFSIIVLLKLIVLLFFSTLGAIIGVNKKEKIRYK